MSDKLSAASLLLAIVAVLYGMWYPLLTESLETKVPQFYAERRKPWKAVREVRNRRALPLIAAAIGVSLVFLPDAVAIVIQSWCIVAREGMDVRDYDSVATAFVLVEVVSVYFVGHFTGVMIAFGRLLKRLSAKDAGVAPTLK
jgi:hypothetical protein